MRDGRFHPPKCRGKVQKIEEETLKGLFSRFLIPTAHPTFSFFFNLVAIMSKAISLKCDHQWMY
jgi:hypothetical protein